MTEKLYYVDAYMKDFTARVESCLAVGDCYETVLDRTAFFPEEGGQYSDSGAIGDAKVSKAVERDGIIVHITDRPLTVGEEYSASIDFEERYEKMQCHSAEHILSGIIHSLFGLNNVGFHLGAEDVTLDVSAPLDRESLARVETLANKAVFEHIDIETLYPTPEEAESLSYRSKLDISENLRVVVIPGYDSCACCAPHVANTSEIGCIKILDAEKLRGGMRIHITAGRRAYRVMCGFYDNLAEISRTLSVPRLETADAVHRTLRELDGVKADFKAARLRLFEREGELIAATEGNLVRYLPDATHDDLRAVANSAKERVEGLLVLVSGTDGAYRYVIASSSGALSSEIKKINAALCGRGGGNSGMAQGSFASSLSEIEKYFT